jgi:hypothetical protein
MSRWQLKAGVALVALLGAGAIQPALADVQTGDLGGMKYYMLPASGGCSAATPCSTVTYLSVQSESDGATLNDLNNYFGNAQFQAANPHTVVIAPVENGPQDATTNWGGYDTLQTPEQQQMVNIVKSVQQSLGAGANPSDSVVTGGSLGGTGTQAALVAYGPKGTVQPGVFSSGVSFDAALWTANSDPSEAAALCGVPLLAVHGTADTNQSITYDQNLQQSVSNACGGQTFTLDPIQGAGHGTWSGSSGYSAGVGSGTPGGFITSQLASGGGTPVTATQTAAGTPATGGTGGMTGTTTTATGGNGAAGTSGAAGGNGTTVTTGAAGANGASGANGTASTTGDPATGATQTTGTGAATQQITPGQGSLTDAQGNTWTITSKGRIEENGTAVSGGGDTSALTMVGGTVWGQDNGNDPSRNNAGGWFTLSGQGAGALWTASTSTPNASPTGTASTAGSGTDTGAAPAATGGDTTTAGQTGTQATNKLAPVNDTCSSSVPNYSATMGGFGTMDGKFYDPSGQPWIANGINVADFDMGAAESDLLNVLPKTNFIRLNIYDGYQDPSAYQSFINWATSHGIVVEVDDHYNWRTDAKTGADLTAEVNFFSAMASAYKTNPYVWFEPHNEPQGGDITAEQVAVYNAIRATGNNNPIGIQLMGGGDPGFLSYMNLSSYTSMTNVFIAPHFYDWLAKYSTDPGTISSALQSEVSQAQQIQTADGTPPVIIDEFGDSTDGSTIDAGGAQTVQAVLNSGDGYAAWTWENWGGSSGDALTSGGALTAMGQQVASGMNTPAAGCALAPVVATASDAQNAANGLTTPDQTTTTGAATTATPATTDNSGPETAPPLANGSTAVTAPPLGDTTQTVDQTAAQAAAGP